MTELDDLLAPGRRLADAGGGILSALDPAQRGAPYDRTSAFYDRLIPSRVYSRLFWSTHPREYVQFAREAVADDDGPMLDAAGGTAIFTAEAYREASRPLVFTDLSLGMLAKARERLDGAGNVSLVQADATDPPFAPGSFTTVACMSALHVFPDPGAVVRALRPLVAPGGRMFLSGLVAETGVGSRYLRLLQRAGEAGPPMSQAELEALIARNAGTDPATVRKGSMTYIVVPVN